MTTPKPEVTFELGSVDQIEVPEITIRYTKDKIFSSTIYTSSDIAKFGRSLFEHGEIEVQEQFFVLFLSRSNKVIGYYKHSKGGLDSTVVDSRLIFAVGLKCLSSQMALVHNHPSGSLKPSEADIRITRGLVDGGKILSLKVLDHVILSTEGYFSFADDGIL